MSGANIPFRGVCLILLWMLLRVGLVSASPTPAPGYQSDSPYFSREVLSKRAQAQLPKFSSRYRGRIQKGTYLKSLFPLDDRAAEQKNGGHAVASPWQDPDVMLRWGWTTKTMWAPFLPAQRGKIDYNVPAYGQRLDVPFADPTHLVDPSKNALSASRHGQPFLLANGHQGQPTHAVYKNVHNPSSGAIVFDVDYSPEYYKVRYGRGDIPDISHVSDVVYFQWLEVCKEKNVRPSSIRTIFVSQVTHKATFAVVQQALWDVEKAKVPEWNQKLTFSMDSRQGLAILGSTWGSAIALFLIQHKATLGLKKITDVTVWGDRRNPAGRDDTYNTLLFLRFTIVRARLDI
ncbi:hypothetical protein LZ31DRAFT_622642 [Colletotrichum somersetense]|nr:hypothetical protein LZ31DRAFT_622642 [Colletotrichum somersetense]